MCLSYVAELLLEWVGVRRLIKNVGLFEVVVFPPCSMNGSVKFKDEQIESLEYRRDWNKPAY
jgi:hypothetical protein